MTSLENLILAYDRMDRTDPAKNILGQILDELRDIDRLNLSQLAERCFTSPSSISRLIKQLGYKSYSEFKHSLSENIRQYEYHGRFCGERTVDPTEIKQLVRGRIEWTLEQYDEHFSVDLLEPIAEAMHEASRVVIFGYGTLFMEPMLQSNLIMDRKRTLLCLGETEQMSAAQELSSSDLALFLAPDAIGNVESVREAVQMAAKRRATIAVFTSCEPGFFSQRSDFVISYPGQRHMIDQLYLQYLLLSLSLLYREKYLNKRSLDQSL